MSIVLILSIVLRGLPDAEIFKSENNDRFSERLNGSPNTSEHEMI